MGLLVLTHTNPSRTEIYRRLERFYESCAASGIPECETVAQTVSTWRREITTAIISGISNAGSEVSASQRLRTRLATTRRARGCLTTKIKHG